MNIKTINNKILDKQKDFIKNNKESPTYVILDYNTYTYILKEQRKMGMDFNKYNDMIIALVYHTELEVIEVR
jgi:hypothetical protein